MAEWAKQTYNQQYEKWVPWLEDVYLRWFTKDNKASYATKDTLDKSKVTGIEQVDTLQDGVHNLAAGQVGQGGLLQPIGDMASKEGVNRAERQGKDDEGGYVPTAVPGSGALNQAGSGVAEGSKTVAGKTTEGVKSAGGLVGGLFGGGAGKAKAEQKMWTVHREQTALLYPDTVTNVVFPLFILRRVCPTAVAEMRDQIRRSGHSGVYSCAKKPLALARKLKSRLYSILSDLKVRKITLTTTPKLHVLTASGSSETLVPRREAYDDSVENVSNDVSFHHDNECLRPLPVDRFSTSFLGRLSGEIREIIFQELWRTAGLGQHIVRTEAGYGHSRCLFERPDCTAVEADDPWEFNWMGSDARGSVSLWYKREMSAWCDHWKCEEARDEREIWRNISKRRTSHGVPAKTLTPYLPMMLTCKTLSTEFTITDIKVARNLFGVRWKTSSSHPLRRINFSFRRQADQGSTFEQWVESWSAILRILDTPQLMTVNLWLDSDIYYERYWLSVTGNVLRRVPEALAHKVAVSLPPDGHGDRTAGGPRG
ncbi:hypothetical protein CORC01_13565 [Colletotrichum orchidophilum]|uniref:Uncharacterized protein n=1 Tax=Colletotrichum orchidophilum TaxID=1209926 RepID=A0A1G4APR1_9PEZI|nr:uncharacterized protein CORC01_13565 [Colletotrichum orchidophilum]OHE91154.1 hypothetical protein CORC01_13565 [Colletotrichum orchidophilum]